MNMKIYEAVRSAPKTAQKIIKGGKLNGFTDINPMWRIKALTEQFGPCGIGWYPELVRQWIEHGEDGRVAAFCNINLYIKQDGEWSKPVPGTGGSMFTNFEKGALVTSDECYKMAFTDALSVACKHLGFGADIYWDKDRTKYDNQGDDSRPLGKLDIPPDDDFPKKASDIKCQECGALILPFKNKGVVITPEETAAKSEKAYGKVMCVICARKAGAK